METPREPHQHAAPGPHARLVVTALALVALALRLPSIGTRSLWLDEAWLANAALGADPASPGQPAASVLAPVPPLFFLLLRTIAAAVGRSPGGLRALPLLASVAAVPLAYTVARRVAGVGIGLAAALAFAAFPAAVTYGQELKPYATDVLVVLALLLMVELLAERPDRPARWLGAAVVEGLAPGLSFPAALVLPAVALTSLDSCRSGRQRAAWAVAQAGAALGAFGWWTASIGGQRDRPAVLEFWRTGFPPPGGIATATWFGEQLGALIAFALDRPVWPFALAVGAGLVLLPRRQGVLALLVAATVLAAAALRLYPFSPGRTSLYALPFVYLPLAATAVRLGTASVDLAGTSRLRQATRVAGVTAALVLFTFPLRASLDPQGGLIQEETAPLIRALAAERQPTDRVYVYYGAAPAFRFYHPEPDPRIVIGGSHRDRRAAYEDELRTMLVPGERLWILFGHIFETEGQSILRDMAIYGDALDTRVLPGASLHLFAVRRGADSVHHIRLPPPVMAPR